MRECFDYEERLNLIDHYRTYPDMKVWVGCNFPKMDKKLLLIGESHYLDGTSYYHHDPENWHEGVCISDKPDRGWIKTRNIISNGIDTKWKDRSKAIYRNIEKALEPIALLCSP